MGFFFDLDSGDQRFQSFVLAGQEVNLLFEVAMHGLFDGLCAGHDRVPAYERGEKSKRKSADAPE
ncbi:hypothetical protein D3C86_2243750 [compost metagenome]